MHIDLWGFLAIAVVASMITAIVRARYGIRRDKLGNEHWVGADGAEIKRLNDEVATLKDRLAVLERITVEKENSLAREIEDLRSR